MWVRAVIAHNSQDNKYVHHFAIKYNIYNSILGTSVLAIDDIISCIALKKTNLLKYYKEKKKNLQIRKYVTRDETQ